MSTPNTTRTTASWAAGQRANRFSIWFVTGGVTLSDPLGSDVYHSWQTTLTKRFAYGLTTRVAYTFSHDISMNTSILIPQYRNYDRYTSALDRLDALVWSATYELPFGRGKQYPSTGRLGAGHGRLDIGRVVHSLLRKPVQHHFLRDFLQLPRQYANGKSSSSRTCRSWAAASAGNLTSIRWHSRQS